MLTKKGIIFDMDGVLIDAMPFHAEVMSNKMRKVVYQSSC
jgi:beta-phosphoglucomutase-like phosphatase (HAD superfamily)